MLFLGASINEAIDWTQDELATTRPLAERVLFSMIADKKVFLNQHGYMLMEEDVDELRKRKASQHRPSEHRPHKRGGYRFHRLRKNAKKTFGPERKHLFLQKFDHIRQLKTLHHLEQHHLKTLNYDATAGIDEDAPDWIDHNAIP